MKKITFIGLGVMGFPMAGHLLQQQINQPNQSLHSFKVFNRNPQKMDYWLEEYQPLIKKAKEKKPELVVEKITPENLRVALADSDCICSCLGNDDDLRSVFLSGLLDSMSPKSLIIDHTTTSANIAREIAEIAKTKQISFLDAPISGGQVGAEKGSLSIMVGGDVGDFKKAYPIMQAYGKNIVHIGKVGSGQTTKMINQICIAGLLQGLSEGLAFGKKAGLDMDQVLSVISQGAAGSWQMKERGKTMIAGKYDFGFAVKWMIKDLGIALEEAERLGAKCDFTKKIKNLYEEIDNQGGTNWDTSSLMKLVDK